MDKLWYMTTKVHIQNLASNNNLDAYDACNIEHIKMIFLHYDENDFLT